jgi:hypothetical protein
MPSFLSSSLFLSLKCLPGARAVATAGTALLSGLLALAPASAQAPDYASVEATPAYWHLSDADSDVYIFGTFHILPADLDWLTGDLANVADTADALYLEADVHSAEGQAAIQGLLPRYGFNPPGVTLSSMLDAETQALLAEFAPTVGASPAMLDPMRPWLAQVVLAVGQMQALGLDPKWIEFEVTETAAIDDMPKTVAALNGLKAAGSSVAMDDFGTGYASLNYLRQLPVDALKIDKSFVMGLLDDENSHKIVKAVVDLAHALDLVVHAEGIETAEQRQRLMDMGCDRLQGYWFSKPLDAQALLAWLEASERIPLNSDS